MHVIIIPFQLGGTIGDIEGMPFVEAFRQFQFTVGSENFCNIHVSLVPQVRQCNNPVICVYAYNGGITVRKEMIFDIPWH